MKKMMVMLLICLMSVQLFSGCAQQVTEAWSADGASHWHEAENGEKVGEEAHSLDENGICSVCAGEIVKFDDGSAFVTFYNEKGDFVSWAEYDSNGEQVFVQTSEYEYDEMGNMVASKTYMDGSLMEECTYHFTGDEEDYPTMATGMFYNEDGTKEYWEYDDRGDVASITYYDGDGSVSYVETYETKYDENDNYMGEKISTDGALSYESFYEFDEDGLFYMYKEIYYNEDGTIDNEIVYDAEGNVIE
ncbi:MAG: hypothetical protein IJ315_01725 [Firmicutes bacterium]|nr:hypothetical protein [Bacillota bacterium]